MEGLFGPVYKVTTTKKLITDKTLADLEIFNLILEYPDEIKKDVKGSTYQEEMDFLVQYEPRNKFIRNLAVSQEGNTLVLFQYVEKHGKILYDMIYNKTANREKERKIFFVFGGTDTEHREEIRRITETQSDAIIVASYGTFSTGINIRNLHNIIFASPSKSRIRNLQSIGRGLRIGENKEIATLFDIVDDFRIGKFTNYTLKHFVERVKIYDEEKFSYKFYNIEIKNGNDKH